MSLKSSSHGGFESKYQREREKLLDCVEKHGEIVGERDRGRVRNNKK